MGMDDKEYFSRGTEFFSEQEQKSDRSKKKKSSQEEAKRRLHRRRNRLAMLLSCGIGVGILYYPEVFGLTDGAWQEHQTVSANIDEDGIPLTQEETEEFYDGEDEEFYENDPYAMDRDIIDEDVTDEVSAEEFPQLTEEEFAMIQEIYSYLSVGDYGRAINMTYADEYYPLLNQLGDELNGKAGFFDGTNWSETTEDGICMAVKRTYDAMYDSFFTAFYYGNFQNNVPEGSCTAVYGKATNQYSYVKGHWSGGLLNGTVEYGEQLFMDFLEYPDYVPRTNLIYTCNFTDDIMNGTVTAYTEDNRNYVNIYGSYVDWGRSHFEVKDGVIQTDGRWKTSTVGNGGYYLEPEEGENVGGCGFSFAPGYHDGTLYFVNPCPWGLGADEYEYRRAHLQPSYQNR